MAGYVYRSSRGIIYITVLYFLKLILLPSISVSAPVWVYCVQNSKIRSDVHVLAVLTNADYVDRVRPPS